MSDASWRKWLLEVEADAKMMTDELLLDKFGELYARVGAESAGLVVLAAGDGDRDYLRIYREELLRRLGAAKAAATA